MIDKSNIKRSFSKSIDTYNDNALVQKLIVKHLLNLLSVHIDTNASANTGTNVGADIDTDTSTNVGAHIDTDTSVRSLKTLEIGCGTGLLTSELSTIATISPLYINDLVEDLCSKTAATHHIPYEHILAGDIETIPLPTGFDLIISSSTFQWLSSPEALFARLGNSLVEGGMLAFSSFSCDNLKEIKSITGKGLQYQSHQETLDTLSHSFEVLHYEENTHTLHFQHPIDVLKHLKSTGVNALPSTNRWTAQKIATFTEKYEEYYVPTKGYTLTYHPIYILAVRARMRRARMS